MNLLTNGCSWTYGGGLNLDDQESQVKRLQSVWPQGLSNLLNCEEVTNLSIGCGSNDRILRTTFDWLSSKSDDYLENTVAVIQWTDPSRYEYYVSSGRAFMENFDEHWALAKIDVVLSKEDIPHTEKIKRSNNFLSTYTPIQGAYKLLFQAEALSNLFDSFRIKYFYWSQAFNVSHTPLHIKSRLLEHNWLDYNSEQDREKWIYDRIPDDGHPSIEGHRQIAKIIYDKIKDRL